MKVVKLWKRKHFKPTFFVWRNNLHKRLKPDPNLMWVIKAFLVW